MRTRKLPIFSGARGLAMAISGAIVIAVAGAAAGVGGDAAAASAAPAYDTVDQTFSGTQDLVIETVPGGTRALVRELKALGVEVTQQFDTVLDGAAVTVTQKQLEAINATLDTVSMTVDTEAVLFNTTTQDAPRWNLDRIDQQNYTAYRSGGSDPRFFTYPASAGAGVTVFVVDSGFTRQNTELDGRLGVGVDLYGGDHGTPTDTSDDTSTRDCMGHGTHVAGTVASTTYGAAKLATIVPIRTFGCSGGSLGSIIAAGIEWAIKNKPADSPAVINLSLGSIGGDSLVDQATQNAVDAGITVVVSAGNGGADSFGDDACFGSTNSKGAYENGTSPARVVDAITVGATGFKFSNYSEPVGFTQDLEHYFSNYGTCVDILAPGGEIPSLDFDSPAASVLSGTSMAAPLVAGVAALYLGENPLATPAEVEDALTANAAVNKIQRAEVFWPQYVTGYPSSRATQTPNLLINTEFLNADTLAPASFTGLAKVTGVDLTWTAPADNQGVASYRVEARTVSAASWISQGSFSSTTFAASLAGLTPNSNYIFRVKAELSDGTGDYAYANISTSSGLPFAPVELTAGTAALSSVPLTWQAPLTLNGGTIDDYSVQYRLPSASSWSTFVHAPATQTAATVTGLSVGTSYEFRVAAHTAQGDGNFSAPVSKATLSGLPFAPVELTAGTAALSSVPLTWQAPLTLNDGTIDDYSVQFRLPSASSWSTFVHAPGTQTAATVTGLLPATTYQFRVAAHTTQGNGDFTDAVTKATLSPATSVPRSLAAGTAAASSVPLTWTVPLTLNGNRITDYLVQYRVTGSSDWSTFVHPVKATTGATVTGLSANTTYQFQVAAHTAAGDSAYTAAVSKLTQTGVTTAPRSLVAGTATAMTVPLTWTAPATLNGGVITDYLVEFRVSGAAEWIEFEHPVKAATGATVTGLSASTTYQFRVAARTAQDNSVYTATVSKATLTGVTTAPRSLVAGTATATSVPLTWTVPLTLNGGVITDYLVQYRVTGASNWSTFEHPVKATTGQTVRFLSANTSYQFRVAAQTAQADSVFSSVAAKATRAS